LADYDKSDLPKLRKQWAGPFTVTQIVNPAAVRLELTGAYRRLHPVVHVSKVKHWVPDDAGRDVPQPPAVELAGEEAMQIERILARELLNVNQPRKGYKYLVKWKGYPSSENAWLPAADFLDAEAKRMRAAYDRRMDAGADRGGVQLRERRGRR
ncbi:MAG: hypothetical protein OIF57_01350, partial [Marinobacterium sp.]|nr:hypothetical protein [Marinobacterium sp.]